METYKNVEPLWNLLKNLYTFVLLMYIIILLLIMKRIQILIMKRI